MHSAADLQPVLVRPLPNNENIDVIPGEPKWNSNASKACHSHNSSLARACTNRFFSTPRLSISSCSTADFWKYLGRTMVCSSYMRVRHNHLRRHKTTPSVGRTAPFDGHDKRAQMRRLAKSSPFQRIERRCRYVLPLHSIPLVDILSTRRCTTPESPPSCPVAGSSAVSF